MPMHDWTRAEGGYHHFHGAWLYSIADYLNGGGLPPGYSALAETAVPPFVPDVVAVRTPSASPAVGLATLPGVQFVESAKRDTASRPRRHLAIRHAASRRVVAIIELVSPGNKERRPNLRAFVEKVIAFLWNGIHVLVIDPFPPTPRDPHGLHAVFWRSLARRRFVPPGDKPLGAAVYVSGEEWRTFAEAFAVGDALPTMPLFLGPDTWVALPLEATYMAAWAKYPSPYRELVEGSAHSE